jgi:hypothetical protein
LRCSSLRQEDELDGSVVFCGTINSSSQGAIAFRAAIHLARRSERYDSPHEETYLLLLCEQCPLLSIFL